MAEQKESLIVALNIVNINIDSNLEKGETRINKIGDGSIMDDLVKLLRKKGYYAIKTPMNQIYVNWK